MGSKTGTSTSSVQIPKEVLARYTAANNAASSAASTPFQTYSNDPNQFVAQFNPTEQTALSGIQSAYGNSAPMYGQAAAATQSGMGQANPGELDVQKYMNPYLNTAVNSTAQVMNQMNQQAMSGQTGNAISQGAFGGDRAGIAAAVLAGQQQMASGNVIAGMENQGYNTALGAAQQQQGLSLAAQQANLARQMAGGQQLAGIGAQEFQNQLAGNSAAMQAGQVQQQTSQAGLSALYNQWLQKQAYPFQTAQFLANIAEGIGAQSGSTTTTQYPMPFFSDRRLKTDIHRIGETDKGLPIYKFRYKADPSRRTYTGLMADDVEKVHPEAVGLAGGYKVVDYDRATRATGGLVGYADGGAPEEYGGGPTPDQISLVKAKMGNFNPNGGFYGRGLGAIGSGGYVPAPQEGLVARGFKPAPNPTQQQFSDASAIHQAAAAGQDIASIYQNGSGMWNALKQKYAPSTPPMKRGGVAGFAFGGDTEPYDANGYANPMSDPAVKFLPKVNSYVPSGMSDVQKNKSNNPPTPPTPGLGGSSMSNIAGAAGAANSLYGLGSWLIPLLFKDGGSVPRRGYDDGGAPQDDLSTDNSSDQVNGYPRHSVMDNIIQGIGSSLGLAAPGNPDDIRQKAYTLDAQMRGGSEPEAHMQRGSVDTAPVVAENPRARWAAAMNGNNAPPAAPAAGLAPPPDAAPTYSGPHARPTGLAPAASTETVQAAPEATGVAPPAPSVAPSQQDNLPGPPRTAGLAPSQQEASPGLRMAQDLIRQSEGAAVNPRDPNGGTRFGFNSDQYGKPLNAVTQQDVSNQITKWYNQNGGPQLEAKYGPRFAAAYVNLSMLGQGRAAETLKQAGGDQGKFFDLMGQKLSSLGGPNVKGWMNRVNQQKQVAMADGPVPVMAGDIPDGPTPSGGGLAPRTTRGPMSQVSAGLGGVGDWMKNNSNILLPILSGIGTMASSNSPFLGGAILQGLGGGAKSYMDWQQQQANIANTKAETLGNINEAIGKGIYNIKPGLNYVNTEDKGLQPLIGGTDAKGAIMGAPQGAAIAKSVAPAAGASSVAAATGQPDVTSTIKTAPSAVAGSQAPGPGVIAPPATSGVPPSDVLWNDTVDQIAQGESKYYNRPGFDPVAKSAAVTEPAAAAAPVARQARINMTSLADSLSGYNAKNPNGLLVAGHGFDFRQNIAGMFDAIFRAAGDTSGVAGLDDSQIVKKGSNLIAMGRVSAANERSLGALDQALTATPTLDQTPAASAKIMAQLLTQNQQDIDRNNFYNDYSGRSPTGTAIDAPRAFDGVYTQPKYEVEKKILADMIATPSMRPILSAWENGKINAQQLQTLVTKAYSNSKNPVAIPPDLYRYFAPGSQ